LAALTGVAGATVGSMIANFARAVTQLASLRGLLRVPKS